MSSADTSPGNFGNLAAEKIDNNEMPATIKNDLRNARRLSLQQTEAFTAAKLITNRSPPANISSGFAFTPRRR